MKTDWDKQDGWDFLVIVSVDYISSDILEQISLGLIEPPTYPTVLILNIICLLRKDFIESISGKYLH